METLNSYKIKKWIDENVGLNFPVCLSSVMPLIIL